MNRVIAILLFSLISGVIYAQTDQELLWGSYYGGNFIDDLYSVTLTSDGGQIIVGKTGSSSGISTPQSHQPTFASLGNTGDGFFLKLNADKTLAWASYFGGTMEDAIYSVDVLSDGSFVVVGNTRSATGISTSNAYLSEMPGENCGFVARFDENGMIIWSTYFGGSGNQFDFPNLVISVKANSFDEIIVCGYTKSTDFPVTPNAFQENHGGGDDGFISKFSTSGELIWSTYYGGSNTDRLFDVIIDDDNNIIVYGETNSSSNIASPGAFQEMYGGQNDVFLAKFNTNGERIWATYFGGPSREDGSWLTAGLSIDENGNLYLYGTTQSEEGIATPGAHDTELAQLGRDFLARFSPDGLLEWGSYFAHLSLGPAGCIKVIENQIVLTGATRSGFEGGVLMGNPYQSEIFSSSNNNDIYIAGFSLNGQQLWGTYYGGTSGESFKNMVGLYSGQILFVGGTGSSNIPVTTDGIYSTYQGSSDGLIAIFQINNPSSVLQNAGLKMNVFPNPTKNQIYIDLPPEFKFIAQLKIFNSLGQQVFSNSNFSSSDVISMPSASGIYFLEATNGNYIVRTKIIKE
jgi:hypothetical protein